MLTSKDLAELFAQTPPCEASELAKNEAGRGFQLFSSEKNDAKFAKLLNDDNPTTSLISHVSQSCESVGEATYKPFLAISQISQGGVAANDDELLERQLSGVEQSSLAIAERAIAQAALTDEQRASRLNDLRRDPAIARFWAMAWPEASEVIALAPPPAQTTGRCVECVSFQLAGMGHRCSHADRVLPNEPPIVECLADNQCHRFVHWYPAQSKDSTS